MRVKTGTVRKRRHKKVLKMAKGYRMTRSRLFKVANEAVLHAYQYAFAGRKLKKRDLRKLWIQRINAAIRKQGLTYSKFINLLKQKNIVIDRKIMADLIIKAPKSFESIVDKAKSKG